MLRALSALDIACCNRAVRPTLLHLDSQLNYAWALSNGVYGQDVQIEHVVQLPCYLRWLADRQVAVQTLYLTDACMPSMIEVPIAATLPLVRVIVLATTIQITDSIDSLAMLLHACPNVTNISTAGWTEKVLETAFWHTLLSFPNLRLSTLEAPCCACDTNALTEVIQMFGQSLSSVWLEQQDAILPVLTSCCEHLKMVHIYAKRIEAGDVAVLLQTCRGITSLSIHGFAGDADHVNEVAFAANADCLRHLSIGFYTDHQDNIIPIPYDSLGRLLNSFPWLDEVQVSSCSYQRSTGHLKLFSAELQAADVDYLVANCCGAKSVEIFVFGDPSPAVLAPIMALIGDALGLALETVIITVFAPLGLMTGTQLLALPLRCPGLKRLELSSSESCGGVLADAHLVQLIKSCPLMENLMLRYCFHFKITDAGMEQLFANGRHLKQVHIDISPNVFTSKALQAILDSQLHLERFSCACHGSISEADVKEFRQSAKALQLFPVPQIVM